MSIQVIGAGLGRTGILSLQAALEELGFAKCYHRVEVLARMDDARTWDVAARGETQGRQIARSIGNPKAVRLGHSCRPNASEERATRPCRACKELSGDPRLSSAARKRCNDFC